MTKVVRHKVTGKFAKIFNPDITESEGKLVDDPTQADIYNKDIDDMEDNEILEQVSYAEFEGIENGNESLWEVVSVKITVEIA